MVPHRPGKGIEVLGALREAGVNLTAFSASPAGGGNAQVDLVTNDLPGMCRVARRNGWTMDAPPFVTAILGYAYGASGDRTRAMATLDDLKRRSPHGQIGPFNLALVYLGLGDRDRAIDNFERASRTSSGPGRAFALPRDPRSRLGSCR